ncbi:MAG: DUF2877 domain-containing protein [Alphaproteobacteria bacterium]|nr:DUF2877 domain-containing protein [Alphaproteobacteria bacterium]
MPETAPAPSVAARPAPLPVAMIGAAARRALGAGATGQVVALFRRSLYLSGADLRLACIGPMEMGAGPLNVLAPLPADIDWRTVGLRVGSAARVIGDQLHVADRIVFPLRQAETWEPQALPDGWRAETVRDNLAGLAAEAKPPAEGLAPWVPALATGALPTDRDDPLLRAAKPPLVALRTWLLEATASQAKTLPVPDRAAGLIGLGPGLTPSGDDLIGGAMIALRALGRDRTADRLADWALGQAREGTGRISRAHLAAAADGQGAAALHAALASLCTTGAPGIVPALRALDAIGHSSGWDALAGAVLAAAAVSPSAAH